MDVTREFDHCCTDCLQYVANGIDDERQTELVECAARIHTRWPQHEANLVVACDEGCPYSGETCTEFTWHGCDLCGSPLGGEKHKIIALG